VYPTSTKQTDTISLDVLADICRAVSIPVVAIGGVDAGNAGVAIDADCAGVAVVSALFDQRDIKAAAGNILLV